MWYFGSCLRLRSQKGFGKNNVHWVLPVVSFEKNIVLSVLPDVNFCKNIVHWVLPLGNSQKYRTFGLPRFSVLVTSQGVSEHLEFEFHFNEGLTEKVRWIHWRLEKK